MNELFFINNFGEVQGANQMTGMYVHDGLDIVSPNGTKIFAVDSGYVKAIIGNPPYYMSMFIEDKNNPGYLWGYTHIYDFNVKEGDFVRQGEQLAVISFQGVEHIHFGRARLIPNSDYHDFSSYDYIRPDVFFEYTDTEPPTFYEKVKYFKNNDNKTITETNNDKIILSGQVDIVAGIRDGGKVAHAKTLDFVTNYGDRLAVDKITYEITDPNGQIFHFDSFDFSKLMFRYTNPNWEKTNVIYKDYNSVNYIPPQNYDKFFSFYIITNSEPNDDYHEITLDDADNSWNTTELKEDGSKRYINGEYTIKVTAYDFKGNFSSITDTVFVNN